MQPSEDPARQPSGQAVIVDANGLPALFDALRDRGYTVVGPTVRDGAIVLAELASVAELPFGWGGGDRGGEVPAAGTVRHRRVRAFRRPAVMEISTAEAGEAAERPRYALLGVRPCDVRAIGILDQVLTGGRRRRAGGRAAPGRG